MGTGWIIGGFSAERRPPTGQRPYQHETAEENDARIRQLLLEASLEIVDGEVVKADGGRTEGR